MGNKKTLPIQPGNTYCRYTYICKYLYSKTITGSHDYVFTDLNQLLYTEIIDYDGQVLNYQGQYYQNTQYYQRFTNNMFINKNIKNGKLYISSQYLTIDTVYGYRAWNHTINGFSQFFFDTYKGIEFDSLNQIDQRLSDDLGANFFVDYGLLTY